MNKPTKRTFVRNTEQKLPEITVKTTQSVLKKPSSTTQRKTTQLHQKTVNFNEPKLNSSKKIIKDICAIQNAIKTEKNVKKSEILEYKITKRMNFPIDKVIYKNLVPLCTKKEPPCYRSPREPLPKKDIEPKLSDYCDPLKTFNYVFKVDVPPIRSETEEEGVKFDGCCLTKHLMLWEEEPELIENSVLVSDAIYVSGGNEIDHVISKT
ncbi:uncharacterized protein [Onthophagus taurus]|uniref:uncharacterized protein isoform X1 n=1 Tax=Onthophagus taurus TaxID=166361 RepID=UPI0039BDF612